MTLDVTDELRSLCRDVLSEGSSHEDWEACASGDHFQSDHFCGGYEPDERVFWFSYYDPTGKEWWLCLTPEEVNSITTGKLSSLPLRNPQ